MAIVPSSEIGKFSSSGGITQHPTDTSWKLLIDHCLWGSVATGDAHGALGLRVLSSGTGATVGIGNGVAGRPGILAFGSGSSASSYMIGTTADDCVLLGGGDVRIGAAFKFDLAPDATNDYYFYFGLTDDWATHTGSDFAGLVIDRAFNSTNWVARTRDASGTPVNGDTGVAFGTDWVNLEVEFAGDGSYIKYYINSVLVYTETTVFPDSVNMSFSFEQKRVAGSAQSAHMDWIYFAHKPNTALGSIASWVA